MECSTRNISLDCMLFPTSRKVKGNRMRVLFCVLSLTAQILGAFSLLPQPALAQAGSPPVGSEQSVPSQPDLNPKTERRQQVPEGRHRQRTTAPRTRDLERNHESIEA